MAGGEPIHPATVHFPITFTVLTGALDALYLASITPATAGIVLSLFRTLDIQVPTTLLPLLSYYSTILTLVTAIPAVISGATQLAPVIQRDGLNSKKAQVGVAHALVNDVTLFGAAYNWWVRRSEKQFVPSTTNAMLSTMIVPVSLFAAYLGGQLVYKHGMGMGGGSSSKSKKSQ